MAIANGNISIGICASPARLASQPNPDGISAAPTLDALVTNPTEAGTKSSDTYVGISQITAGKKAARAKPMSGRLIHCPGSCHHATIPMIRSTSDKLMVRIAPIDRRK